jgi:hypothetical protein
MRSTSLSLILVCLGAAACTSRDSRAVAAEAVATDTIIRALRDTIIKHSVAGMRDTIIKQVSADCCDQKPRPAGCPPEADLMADTIIK